MRLTPQEAVRRYLLVAASLLVLGLIGLIGGLSDFTFHPAPWVDREALLVGGGALVAAGAWQLWTLMFTQLRMERQSRAMATELEMMASVAQHTGSAVVVSDDQHNVVWCNEAFTRVTGYRLDEVRGSRPGQFLRSPAADATAIARLEQAIQTWTGVDLEILHRYKDGRDRWVRMLLSPVECIGVEGRPGFIAVLVDIEEQVRTREALRNAVRDNEALMRTLDEHAIVSETDARGIITRVNRRFAEISGYPADELVGSHHRIVSSGLHPPEFWAGMWSTIRSGQSWSDEICNRARDGRLYWVHSLIVPFVGHDGEVEKYVSIRLDITARKQAEAQLRTSQELLSRTSRIAGIGGWYAELGSHNLYLSEECREILRIEPGDTVVLEDLWRKFEGEAAEQARQQLQAMARMEQLSVDLVARMQGSQPGQAQWVRMVAEIDWQGGDSERVVGAVQDITFQIRTQQRIEEEQRILRGAIDALGEGFVLFDPDDRLVYCNDKYRELYAPIQEYIQVGAFYENIVRAATAAGIFKDSAQDREGWIAVAMREHDKLYSDRVREMHDGRWLRIIEGRTSDNYHVGFRIDITALQNALIAADAAARSKGQFLANMSHEIRTPINAIMGLLQLLGDTPLTPQQNDQVQKARMATRSLLDILNDILDYSKVEAGKMELNPEPFELAALARELGVILSGALGTKQLELSFDVDPRIPAMLVGDALRLKQVLIKLGGNAIKFTAIGSVRVMMALAGQDAGRARVRFSVQDTGIGITLEQQQRIFIGFSQAEASTARRFGGTGLGLAISQRLVALMGGELAVESVSGQGSVFSFEVDFPVATGAAALPPSVQTRLPAGSPGRRLQGLRLLLAEDNVPNQEVALAMLRREGAEVVLVDNGWKAIQALRAEPKGYDLVLMDMQMPGMDGCETTERIKALHAHLSTPVIALTAGATVTEKERALKSGMVDFLTKPVEPTRLIRVLREHIEAHRGEPLRLAASQEQVTVASQTEPARPSPQAPAGQGAGTWPQIEGIDSALASSMMGGDVHFFAEMLSALRKEHESSGRALEDLVGKREFESAARLAHKLKGQAGNVGAMALHRAAGALEVALLEKVENVDDLVAAVGAALKTIMEAKA